jgi:hypothetical protein
LPSGLLRRFDRVVAALLLLGYGAWIGSFALREINNPKHPLDAAFGWIALLLQAGPSLFFGIVVALDVIAVGQVRPLRIFADIAVGAGAFVVLSLAVLYTVIDSSGALPFYLVGLGLVGTMFAGRWPSHKRG